MMGQKNKNIDQIQGEEDNKVFDAKRGDESCFQDIGGAACGTNMGHDQTSFFWMGATTSRGAGNFSYFETSAENRR